MQVSQTGWSSSLNAPLLGHDSRGSKGGGSCRWHYVVVTCVLTVLALCGGVVLVCQTGARGPFCRDVPGHHPPPVTPPAKKFVCDTGSGQCTEAANATFTSNATCATMCTTSVALLRFKVLQPTLVLENICSLVQGCVFMLTQALAC